MSDNIRFHSKYHAKLHHTDATPGDLDSAIDPLAGPVSPFHGSMFVDASIFAGYGTGVGMVSAPSLASGRLTLGLETFVGADLATFIRAPQNAVPVWGQNINTGDQHWDKVVLYTRFDGTHLDTALTDLSIKAQIAAFDGDVYISDADSKFGETSLYCPGVSGSVNFQNIASELTSNHNWTIEFWCKPIDSSHIGTPFSINPFNSDGYGPYTLGLSALESSASTLAALSGSIMTLHHLCMGCASDSCCEPPLEDATVLTAGTDYGSITYTGASLSASQTPCFVSLSGTAPPRTNLVLNSWNHVALTDDGWAVRLFVNGRYAGSAATTQCSHRSVINPLDQLTIGAPDRYDIPPTSTCPTCHPATIATTDYFKGYIDEFRVTAGVARYVHNFFPREFPFATDSYESPTETAYQCQEATLVAQTYGSEIQFKSLLPGDNVNLMCTTSSVKVNAWIPGLAGEMVMMTDQVPISASPSVTFEHGLSGVPEIVRVGLELLPLIYPTTTESAIDFGTGTTGNFLSGEVVGIQEFSRAGTYAGQISGMRWDELYSVVSSPTTITVTRNMDWTSWDHIVPIGQYDEALSVQLKNGLRHYFTDEADLSGNFRLHVTAIKGGLNYTGANDLANLLRVDPFDLSLFESTSSNGDQTYRYWKIAADGVKMHHIAPDQIKTYHIDDRQITTRTLATAVDTTPGTYRYPSLTVDRTGRIQGISSLESDLSAQLLALAPSILAPIDLQGNPHRPVDVYHNKTEAMGGGGYSQDLTTERISFSGTFGYLTSGFNTANGGQHVYDRHFQDSGVWSSHGNPANVGIPRRTDTTCDGCPSVGQWDPTVIKLPKGKSTVKMRLWGAGSGSNLHNWSLTNSVSSAATHGGAGAYTEATYTFSPTGRSGSLIAGAVDEITVWIGKGGESKHYGETNIIYTGSTAFSRPHALSAVIPAQDVLNNIWWDQMHQPGCGGDTFVTVKGVSGNDVVIAKAYGGGKGYGTYDDTSVAAAYTDWNDVGLAAGGGTSSTIATQTDFFVPDLNGNIVSGGACTFFTDPFDPGFGNAWSAGGGTLSGLEHVLGIELPTTANTNVTAAGVAPGDVFEDYYRDMLDTDPTKFTAAGVTVHAEVEHRQTYVTFSAPGEFGTPVYQETMICMPATTKDMPANQTLCYTYHPWRGAAAFGSNARSYGAGGNTTDVELRVNDLGQFMPSWNPQTMHRINSSHGMDGGAIIELLP